MKRIIWILLLSFMLVSITGCIHPKLNPNPILTSKDQSWYIPKGETFKAKKSATEPITELTAEDDLMVLYMGSYLELEKQANKCSR